MKKFKSSKVFVIIAVMSIKIKHYIDLLLIVRPISDAVPGISTEDLDAR